MERRPSIVIAVTGGMGTGQSTVCHFLEKMGAKIIHADAIAKQEIESNHELKMELKSTFGNRVFYRNGKLNRKLLASLAFANEANTWRLNRLVHPRMVSRIIELIEEARDSEKFSIIAVDAALIYELNLEHMFDAVVVVAAKMRHRLDRIKNRDKLSEREILNRISKQLPLGEKMKWADFVIRNNRDLDALERSTRKLHHKLKQLVHRKTAKSAS